MRKKDFKSIYVPPFIQVLVLHEAQGLLAGSPDVQPGGGGSGGISVTPPDEDGDDDDLSGAKGFDLWENEGE